MWVVFRAAESKGGILARADATKTTLKNLFQPELFKRSSHKTLSTSNTQNDCKFLILSIQSVSLARNELSSLEQGEQQSDASEVSVSRVGGYRTTDTVHKALLRLDVRSQELVTLHK